MKKQLTILIGCLIFMFMLATPGKTVLAAVNGVSTTSEIALKITSPPSLQDVSPDCSCHEATPLVGAERNKIVAELISSGEFKLVKQTAQDMGYQWLGAQGIEVVKFTSEEGGNILILTGVPFSKDGQTVMFVFKNGTFAGLAPKE